MFFLQQLAVDLRLDAEHQLLPLAGRLHGLGRELRGAGDIGHLRRNHILRRGVEHDAHLAAQRHLADHRLGQEEGHVDIAEIHQVEHLAAAGQDLAGLRDAVLHAAGARGLELAVLDVGLDAGDGRLARRHAGVGTDDLRPARP